MGSSRIVSKPWPAIQAPSSAWVMRAAREGGREAAGADDADRVGERLHLVEVLGDQEDGGAAGAGVEQAGVDVGDRADVEAAGRLVGEDDRAGPARGRGRG